MKQFYSFAASSIEVNTIGKKSRHQKENEDNKYKDCAANKIR